METTCYAVVYYTDSSGRRNNICIWSTKQLATEACKRLNQKEAGLGYYGYQMLDFYTLVMP